MCGRFCFVHSSEVIEERYGISVPSLFNPTYNAAPAQILHVISSEDKKKLSFYRWSLELANARKSGAAYGVINARAETLEQKSMFKKLVGRRQCIVPVSGFYEWKREGRKKRPCLFTTKEEIFSLAGLWDYIPGEDDNFGLYCFTIITRPAEGEVSKLHNRMPLILRADEEKNWLECAFKAGDIPDLGKNIELKAVEVSPEVNRVSNNHPGLIRPYSSPDNPTLF